MSNGKNCILYPKVITPEGVEEDSRMYKDFLSKKELRYPRPLVNMLYASYITSNIEQAMEAVKKPDGSPKYRKNRQGQFGARDIVDFLDFDKAIGEINSFSEEEYRVGATASINGSRVDYTDALDALERVEKFNENHKGLVASVIEHSTPNGSVYNIQVYEKNSKTVHYSLETKEKLQAWDIYKQVFNAVGVDITKMPQELDNIFSPYNIGLDRHLRNLLHTDIQNMYRKDALLLFHIDAASPEIQRLVASFGSIENAAMALDDLNHGNTKGITSAQKTLLVRAVNHAKKLHGVDINALVSQIDSLQKSIRTNSPEMAIKNEIHRLNKKYHIDINDTDRIHDGIKSLSEANAEAVMQIKRKLASIVKEKGRNAEGKRLEILRRKLIQELGMKHYYSGIIDYLKEAIDDTAMIDQMILNIPQSGDERTRIFNTMKTFQDIKRIRDQYYSIVSALASDNIGMDEAISQTDIDNIKKQASDLKNFFDKKDSVIEGHTKNIVRSFMRMATNGKMTETEINDVLEKEAMDSSWADKWLYSMGTSSNVLIAAAGTVMRNQEDIRDDALSAVKKRINVAHEKLKKAGFNTEFMYEDQKHIISDIDWGKYEAAKRAEENNLYSNGLRDFDLKQGIEDWVEMNTEDRVVDHKSGRTERVPGQAFRKKEDFQKDWTPEQIEYYNTMMQLKGELETLYPDHARNYYLPPQVRRNMVDAISDAKGIKDVGKAVANKVKDPFIIREDDTDYVENAIVNGEETAFTEGNYDNTPKKNIPIFFQKNVEEGELLRDFSSGMIRYASSAINYDAMNEIKDVMELLRDYAVSKRPALPKSQSEVTGDRFMRVTKQLYKWGKQNDAGDILNGFIDQHIYGVRRMDSRLPKGFVKFLDNIVQYTSFKGLVFNAPGATANALMGVQQIFIDAGSGEFFGFKDLAWATKTLFGDAGLKGEAMEIFTNNAHHKAKLLRDMFDPMQENYENDRGKRYHNSLFRQLVSKDCSFIGYSSGEYVIHMLPMYAMLHNQKVMLNGEKISLYDAFEVTPTQDRNAELKVKDGVTDLDGNPITKEFIHNVKGKIRYANQSMHGAMNAEDKGLIHQYIAGRLIMNFRQWMVGHYSRRFRKRHFDFSAGDWREGYWISLWKGLINDDTKDTWKIGHKKDAMWMFVKDFATFMFRASSQWSNLNEMQRYNVKRVRAEMCMLISLLGLSFALGEPDDHKQEFWRRWWIYQTKRMITETEASMPNLAMGFSLIKILQSPMAGINTLNSLLYVLYGLTNGDLFETIKSGDHKGENRYWRNVIKYDLPFFKDWETLQKLDKDDSLFKVFENSPSNH